MFDPSKPVEYESENNRIFPARIIATDALAATPIVALVSRIISGKEVVMSFNKEGNCAFFDARLRNIVVKTEKFMNLYKNSGPGIHSSHASAMANRGNVCEGTIKLSYEDGILASVSLVGEE